MRMLTVFERPVPANRFVLAMIILANLTACGLLSDKGPEAQYRDAVQGRSLELPPELGVGASKEARVQVPAVSTDCEPCAAAAIAIEPGTATVLPRSSKARFVRSGELSWLEIEQAPELSWQLLQRYVQLRGFDVSAENALDGIIDTDWVSINDSNAPGGLPLAGTRSLADELGRFRFGFRLERTPRDTSRVFVRHEALLKRADADELAINDAELSNRLLMDLLAQLEGRAGQQSASN